MTTTAGTGATGGGSADLPWPGDELVLRVAGGADREAFYQSGRQSVTDIERALALVGRQLASYETILDFGCGCGRIMLWLRDAAPASSLHGVDIDERAIRWVNGNIPGVQAKVNDVLPPLGYPDGFFDLVYNHSVFTHIDEADQDAWLTELRRVTKPGGHLVLTVHGQKALDDFEVHSAKVGGDDWVRQQVRRRGIVFIKEDAFVGGPFPDTYHSTFHAPWYVLDRWGDVFDVRGYIPGGSLGFQDSVVLERRADELPALKPLGPLPPAPTPAAAAPDADPDVKAKAAASPVVGARALLAKGPELPTTTRFGSAGRGARRLLLRALRHHYDHQRQVADVLLDSFEQSRADLDEAVTFVHESLTAAEGLSLREANIRLWEALRQQGERINRLESDLWAALDAKPSPPPQG